jgi:hypothetical protein
MFIMMSANIEISDKMLLITYLSALGYLSQTPLLGLLPPPPQWSIPSQVTLRDLSTCFCYAFEGYQNLFLLVQKV